MATVQLTEAVDTFPLTAECDKFKQQVEQMAADGEKIDKTVGANQKLLKQKRCVIPSSPSPFALFFLGPLPPSPPSPWDPFLARAFFF